MLKLLALSLVLHFTEICNLILEKTYVHTEDRELDKSCKMAKESSLPEQNGWLK
jgi:hypothetical protein